MCYRVWHHQPVKGMEMSERLPEQGEYIICPNKEHSTVTQMWEDSKDDSMAVCPDCNYTCQSFLKYPVAEIYSHTSGELYLKNVLTGERVLN